MQLHRLISASRFQRCRWQLSVAALLAGLGASLAMAADWRQFRGTDNRSVANEVVPVTWSAEQGIAWQCELEGEGVSSPIVVDGRIFVTASSGPRQDRLHVMAIDARSGSVVWHRQFWATGRTLHHPTSSVAANSPASDGERIFAFFSSNDLFCLDLDGNLLWLRGLADDYPKIGNDTGMASSPVVVDETVVVQVECQQESFVAGLEVANGVNRWRLPRPESANWASPTVLAGNEQQPPLVLIQGGDGLGAYEPKTGRKVWEFTESCASIPSATSDGETIYVPADGVTALRYEPGSSDATFLWQSNKLAVGSASPIVHDGKVFATKRAGVVACGDAASGDVLWQLRLEGTFWATPVMAGGHLYFVNQDGLAQVVDTRGEEGEIVSRYDFGEPVLGSPAVADGAIYFRGESTLWKVAGPAASAPGT